MKEYMSAFIQTTLSKHKWIIFLSLAVCIILGFAIYRYFSSDMEIAPIERNMANDGVITVLEGELTRTSCIYEVPKDISITGDYSIDVLKNHKWQELEPLPGKEPPNKDYEDGTLPIDLSFYWIEMFNPEESTNPEYLQFKDLILERTNQNHTHMYRVDWDNVYGSLKNGTYRLVLWKSSGEGKTYYYVPFTIDDTIS